MMTRISNPEIVGTPPNLWPPALELPSGKWLGQTAVIINYLSPRLGLAGYAKDDPDLDEDEKAFLNAKNTQLVLTVMDMLVEVSFGHLAEGPRSLVIHRLVLADPQRPPSDFR